METIVIEGPKMELEPIDPSNVLVRVFIVYVYARNGGVVGLGGRYFTSRKQADDFCEQLTSDEYLSKFRTSVVEYEVVVK